MNLRNRRRATRPVGSLTLKLGMLLALIGGSVLLSGCASFPSTGSTSETSEAQSNTWLPNLRPKTPLGQKFFFDDRSHDIEQSLGYEH